MYTLKMAAFGDTAPYSHVGVDRRLRGSYCLHPRPDFWRQYAPLKRRVYCNETTWHNIPEGCNLHTRRRENLTSHV
jgi:hypothetical protein